MLYFKQNYLTGGGDKQLINISGKIHLLKNFVDANMSVVYMELIRQPTTNQIHYDKGK